MNKNQISNIFSSKVGVSIKEVSKIEKGVETSFIVVGNNFNKYFIKFLNSGYFEPEGFLAGAFLMKTIKNRTEIPVPEVYYISKKDPKLVKNPFYITEYIEGKNIDNYISEISFSKYKQMFKELGEYTAQFNNINVDTNSYGWGGYFEGEFRSFSDRTDFTQYIYDMIKDSTNKMQENNPMIRHKKTMIKTMKNIKKLEVKFDKPCLVNYDIKFDNLILNRNNKNKIIKSMIDWDNPVLAPPIYNIIKFERHFITGACKNMSFEKRKKLFQIYLKYYSKNCNFNTDVNSLQADLCRLEDYILVSKHFNDYYGQLDERKQEEIYNYYKNRIQVLSKKIEYKC